mgnify:CR=1 FL=1
MKGDLEDTFEKNGNMLTRKLNEDKSYNTSKGQYKLPGRSVMLIRNVGHLMTNSSIFLKDESEIPEGIMDAFLTTAAAIHDLKKKRNSISKVDNCSTLIPLERIQLPITVLMAVVICF